MGCCGCDNKTSANTAGIFALVQCVVGIGLAIYNLNVFNGQCYLNFYNSKGYICGVLDVYTTIIRALLIVVLVLYIIWAISSVLLLIGNAQNRAGYVRQWVGLSVIVIICDIIFPGIIAIKTYSTILNEINRNTDFDRGRIISTYGDVSGLSWNYIALLLTFSRGGLITWISDIALTVYASRRASEIQNPPATYVFTQAIPTTTYIQTTNPPQYIQGYAPPQQGYGQPYFQPAQAQPNYYQPPHQQPSDNKGPPPVYNG